MHVLVTGGTGYVGRFVVADLLGNGHRVTLLGRRPAAETGFVPWTLGAPSVALPAADGLVHCALDHLPGHYRGGEGADPDGFWAHNVMGSLDLFDSARLAGIHRAVFLSSRAVYGDARSGAVLDETDSPAPDTLYGRAKQVVEMALPGLAADGLAVPALRATGVYGLVPGSSEHKWRALFAAFLKGEVIAPRVATEVHGADLARAVTLLLTAPAGTLPAGAFNISDVVLDRNDLLARFGAIAGCPHPPPTPADAGAVSQMATGRLRALGWLPGGAARLEADLPHMAEIARADLAARG